MELKSIEEEIVATEESTAEVENVGTATTEENKLCVWLAKELYKETNKERIADGLPILVWSDELAVASDIRAEDIIECFDHGRINCLMLMQGQRVVYTNNYLGFLIRSDSYDFR